MFSRTKNWAQACRTLRLKNCSLFISGSNSKLLSREFTKELSGRYVSFRIRPFVYKEALEYCTQLSKSLSITDYLVWGGFPKRFEFSSDDARKYLNEINETIILNDLINRYKIRKTEIFKNIARFILISNARIISARSIEKSLNAQKIDCSIATITKYISYLEEAYAIEHIKQYSSKAKKELTFYTKMYNADVALNSIHCIDSRYDLTHNLENIVYNELLYMQYNLKVFTINNKEIDFIAEKNGKKYFIQVAYSVADEKTYEREFAPFALLDNANQKILITNDELDYSTSTVRHIKLKDFLLMNDLE